MASKVRILDEGPGSIDLYDASRQYAQPKNLIVVSRPGISERFLYKHLIPGIIENGASVIFPLSLETEDKKGPSPKQQGGFEIKPKCIYKLVNDSYQNFEETISNLRTVLQAKPKKSQKVPVIIIIDTLQKWSENLETQIRFLIQEAPYINAGVWLHTSLHLIPCDLISTIRNIAIIYPSKSELEILKDNIPSNDEAFWDYQRTEQGMYIYNQSSEKGWGFFSLPPNPQIATQLSDTEFEQQEKIMPISFKSIRLMSTHSRSDTKTCLIVTVTKVEALAFLEAFSQNNAWRRETISGKIYYDLGTLNNDRIYMVQSEMGISTPGGALVTIKKAIDDLKPQTVIMGGIAFGLHADKQKLGEILVSKQIVYYESQRIDAQKGDPIRGDRVTVSESLLDKFRSGDLTWQGASTHFGTILSGEKLVNSIGFRDWLLSIEPEAIGGEMEAAGLYVAARTAKVDYIIIKAICDWGDGTKNDGAQKLAAKNAAEFVYHVLSQN